MTPSQRQNALEDMPNIVGTPDTGAYQRSLERLLKWYDTYYKTIRECLSSNETEMRFPKPPEGI